MPLTFDQEKIIRNRFDETGCNPNCQACGENNWEFDGIAAIPVLNDKNELDPEMAIPTIFMICTQCGYIMQFSAIKLGLVVGV